MAIVLFLLPSPSTLLFTLAKAALGLAIYLALLLAVDKQARDMLNLIIDEIKGMLRVIGGKNNSSDGKNALPASEN